MLLSGNLVCPEPLQSRSGLFRAQPAEWRCKTIQNGIGIGTRRFQQLNGIMRPISAGEVTWGPRCIRGLLRDGHHASTGREETATLYVLRVGLVHAAGVYGTMTAVMWSLG